MVPDMSRVGKAVKRAPIGLITPRTVIVTPRVRLRKVLQKESPALLRGAQP
jgi:hypothetical protein